jgi:conjugative relaxase-like TrwC/TraI family protein
MFTMAKIKDGSTYLSKHLTANDYYCENETVVGQWVGHGAEKLNLHGEIKAGDPAFENLRNNRHPDGSGKLTPRDGHGRVKFFDFQCSAQKSVSVMGVTMGDTRLLAAHDAAALLAFGEMERFAARQDNTFAGRANQRTSNVVAAAFRHTASRALDPQVHTHFVTANATWDLRTKSWRALTEFEMVSAIRYAGKVYQNEMARSCLALGYDIVHIRDNKGGVTGFEIAGVSAAMRERFSKRRAEVEAGIAEFRAEFGREPTPSEVHSITTETRNAKLTEITTPAVLAAQRAQLSSAELGELQTLKTEAGIRAGQRMPAPGRESQSLVAAISHLYERQSVVTGHAMLAEALNQNLGGVELSRLHAKAKEAGLVGLTDERWVHQKFATVEGLTLEKWAVDFVDRTRGLCQPLGGKNAQFSPHLSADQRKAAEAVLASSDQVVCLRGAAGVGKSTVLREIYRELVKTGVAVFCCAPTSSAADTLRKDGLAVTTLSAFLRQGVGNGHEHLRGSVIICDEIGLTSNRQGAELLAIAEQHSARVLFLGDSRQHAAVEAGDFLRVLESHSKLHRVELTAIRRQENKAYRTAVRCLAAGAARVGLERLDDLGWVKEGRSGYLRGAVEDFMRLSDDGRNLGRVLAVTPTWAEHEAFTAELRTRLKARGVLGPGENITVHEPLKWTAAQTRNAKNYEPGMVVTFNRSAKGFKAGDFSEVSRVAEGNVFLRAPGGERWLPLRSGAFSVARAHQLEVAPGDRLLIRANDRGSGVLNGEVVTVAGVEAGIIEMADGRRIDSRRFGGFAHGFAVTSHASQSKTVEHVVVAAERLTAKAAYVACSRGQVSCVVHTPDKTALLDRLPDGNREAALDRLGADHSLARKALDRTLAWALSAGSRARMLPEALRRIAARVRHRRPVYLDADVRQAHVPRYRLDLGVHHSSSTRPDRGPSIGL